MRSCSARPPTIARTNHPLSDGNGLGRMGEKRGGHSGDSRSQEHCADSPPYEERRDGCPTDFTLHGIVYGRNRSTIAPSTLFSSLGLSRFKPISTILIESSASPHDPLGLYGHKRVPYHVSDLAFRLLMRSSNLMAFSNR